jgi:AraC-like DNA-binding protein
MSRADHECVAIDPDPLSAILDSLSFGVCTVREAALTRSPHMAQPEAAPGFCAVVEGECCIRHNRAPDLALERGDVVIFVQDGPGRLVQDGRPALAGSDAFGRAQDHRERGLACVEQNAATRLVCARFVFSDRTPHPFWASLPERICVRGSRGRFAPILDESIHLILRELGTGRAGGEFVLNHLAQMVCVEAVRHHIESLDSAPTGFLRGVVDPDVGLVLGLIHRNPCEGWTVAGLAEQAGVSRSYLSKRFRELAGASPMQYLTDLRMRKACRLLQDGSAGLKEIAAGIGYHSVFAFSKAFKRWAGRAPSDYRAAPVAVGQLR